ncbi:MAG: multicopper oxidase domain-containing protein [Rhodobacteraceae bacterium]|nr:multicopper oxidase domain-containing protein [Paracoccaceae bacterium]
MRWGIFTATGALALKNGLSPFASSAFAQDIPTGTPRTPLFGALPFTQPMPRLTTQEPLPLAPTIIDSEMHAVWPAGLGERTAKRLSYHTEFTASGGANFRNPVTNRGPLEGRPPGDWFAHQRWEEFFPQVGFLMSIGEIAPNTAFHPQMAFQDQNKIWAFAAGGLGANGLLPPPLIKMRYGEPAVARIYNSLPTDRANNGGFGRNEPQIHNHNAHNASGSDGAANTHHFPGTFYDYHWTTTLARTDMINTQASDRRASGPDGNGGLINVPGDFREIQSSLWFHDHRFFFTAENVYKGMAGMLNYYSGPDRGNEQIRDGVNLRFPSGKLLDWGNIDFDINMLIADFATDPDGQYFFDIFDTDGFVGDQLHVNFAYKPYFEVLPRKYRLRLLNACMSRFLRLQLVDEGGDSVPFRYIANDGNLMVRALQSRFLDPMGTAERFDIIVDFSQFQPGQTVQMINRMEHKDGRGPEGTVSLSNALNGGSEDPAVGGVMQFRVVNQVESVDVPGVTHYASAPDRSRNGTRRRQTQQIPIIEPVRTRHMEWKRLEPISDQDARDPVTGMCFPDCDSADHFKESFPWATRVNGEDTHNLNANRIAALIPRPGETEHWTFENSSGGWDHPIHLHFEEGVTIGRSGIGASDAAGETEHLQRKDVWRLGREASVTIQVTFGDFGGAYVSHCHNTIHEDFAMLIRWDLLAENGSLHDAIVPTPYPSEDGCTYIQPEILPEADPDFDQATLDPLAQKTRQG